MPVLEVRELIVRRGECPVVDRLSFTLSGGEVLALVGPNGAGKSTAFKGLLGLLPAEGSVLLDGEEVLSMEPRLRARRIAWVPQRSRLNAAMSCTNVVAMGRFAHSGGLARMAASDATAVAEALALADATHLAARPFTAISAGEQQRVLLARALATGATTILMDEPTASLDVGHALGLLATLRQLAASGRAVAVVLHDLEEVRQVADRVIVLHRGQTVAQGAVGEILLSAAVPTVFGVEAVPGGALGFRLPGATCV